MNETRKRNSSAVAGLFLFVGLPILALAFACGPCQHYERGSNFTDGPYRLPTHEQPVEPRKDRWA
jgi:hypothetical protein